LNNVKTYVYDAYGNLLSKQDPGGNCSAIPATACTRFTYDAANQLTGISYSDGVTPNVSNVTYDGDGQRLGMTDGSGTSSFGWDSLHRMVTYTNGNGAQVQWVYNLRNLATTITYPGSLNVTRGYDNAGRWTSVQDWNSNTTTFGYDADSNLTSETFPAASGVVDTFIFNAADQMTNVGSMKGGNTLFSSTYARDSANQLTSDSSAASGTGLYKYTALNQVCYAGSNNSNACASPPSGSIAYAYDAADNLTQKGSTQQAFNPADELCWTASTSGACASPPSGATTYQYDNRGSRTGVTPTGGQAQTLNYDQANRMTNYAAASTTSYGYNADGLRMCKFSGSSSQPCQAGGNTSFVWDAANAVPVLIKDGITAYVYGPGGLPLEQVSGSTTYWFHHDQLGSTRLMTDSTGVAQATYTYDPFGGLASSTGTITNPFRFSGQYLDGESGFYYLRARYYDPATGQFASQDPLISTTREPYGYVRNNPTSGSDPSGLCWPWCTMLIGAAIGVTLYVGLSYATGHHPTWAGAAGAAAAGAVAGLVGPAAGGAIASALGIEAAAGTLGAVATGMAGGAVTGMLGGIVNCGVQQMFPRSAGGQVCTPQRAALYMATGAMFGAAGGVSGAGYSAEYGSVMEDGVSMFSDTTAAWAVNQLAISCMRGAVNGRLTGSSQPT